MSKRREKFNNESKNLITDLFAWYSQCIEEPDRKKKTEMLIKIGKHLKKLHPGILGIAIISIMDTLIKHIPNPVEFIDEIKH